MKRSILSIIITALIILGSAYSLFPFQATNSAESVASSSTFYFSEAKAIDFYLSLNKTGFGLLTDSPGSKSVYLADDQALDYYALSDVYLTTQNSTANSLASQVNTSMLTWGGFFKYWNPVFEILGRYPNTSEPQSAGPPLTIGNQNGFTINTTEYAPNPNFNYSQYSDQLAYRVLLKLHLGNYSTAESLFKTLNSTWDGRGFADRAFRNGSEAGTYQSYKLALFEIVWNTLQTTPSTKNFSLNFSRTVDNVSLTMSELQSANSGGVWTGYKFTNGQIEFGPLVSSQNGETTSVFVLAASTSSHTSSTMSTTCQCTGPTLWYVSVVVIVIGAVVLTTIFFVRRKKISNL